MELRNLSKAFGKARAVEEFSLTVPRGSFTTLLGPSGSGKTTVLRMVAGFVEPDSGDVLIGGRSQAGRPPNRRGVGLVFQDYALFPHMDVRANLSYGLRRRRIARAETAERVERTLASLDLEGLSGRYPHQLSGGQQQRVALGRVLVLEPEVLLMDEPFSNLDARLRLRLRVELKELQRELGITTLYVTHDQEEALSLSDSVVAMDRGRVQQVGTPHEIYLRPASRFVAEFVGDANLLPAQAESVSGATVTARALSKALELRLPDERRPDVGQEGLALVRPEHVVLTLGEAEPGAGWSALGTVRSRAFLGAYERYWLEIPGAPTPWLADAPLLAGGGTSHGANHGTNRSVDAAADDSSNGGAGGGIEPGATVTVTLRPGAGSWLW